MHTALLDEARLVPQPLGGTRLITRLIEECERLMRYNIEVQESLQEAHVKYVKDTDILFLARKAAERERNAALAVIADVVRAVIPANPPTPASHPPSPATGADSRTTTHTTPETGAGDEGVPIE